MAAEALHGGFPHPWRHPPAWLGPAGRDEYLRVLRVLSAMRGERPPLDRGRLIRHCEAVDAGDLKEASKLVFALKHFEDGRRPKPLAGRPSLVVDNTSAPGISAQLAPKPPETDEQRAHRLLDQLERRQREAEELAGDDAIERAHRIMDSVEARREE